MEKIMPTQPGKWTPLPVCNPGEKFIFVAEYKGDGTERWKRHGPVVMRDARKYGIELKTTGEITVEEDPSDAKLLATPAPGEVHPLFRHRWTDKEFACCVSPCPDCPTPTNVGQPAGMPRWSK
jgi:hypothetical protein